MSTNDSMDLALPSSESDTKNIGYINALRLDGVSLFSNRADMYKFIHHEMMTSVNPHTGKDSEVATVLNSLLKEYQHADVMDSSLGGNEVMNPLPGFGFDDDIVYPMSKGDGEESGAGEVYHSMYNQQMQQLHLMFGSISYTDLASFYGAASDITLAPFFRGDVPLSTALARAFGTAARTTITLPFKPPIMVAHMLEDLTTHPVSKYCEFNPTMPTYYRMATGILVMLAQWMGSGLTASEGESDQAEVSHLEKLFQSIEGVNGESSFLDDMQGKIDICSLLSERQKRRRKQTSKRTTIDDVLTNEKETFFSQIKRLYTYTKNGLLKSGFAADTISAATGGMQYISFRVVDSDNATESFNNEVGTSSIAQRVNGKSQEASETRFSTGGWKTGVDFIDGITGFMKDFLSSTMHSVGAGALVESKIGNGFFDFPDVWKGAKFSKTSNIELQLRAPGGAPELVLQSIYVPLALVLAGVAPRQIGRNMYTNPFYVRCYCKGQFTIPLGIIESVTIKRGAGDFGWSQAFLPTALDLSITIRDLSPILYMGMADANFFDVLSANVGMQEYIKILAGVGLKEQIELMPNVTNNLAVALKMTKLTYLNSSYAAIKIGESALGQAVGAILPFNSGYTNR